MKIDDFEKLAYLTTDSGVKQKLKELAFKRTLDKFVRSTTVLIKKELLIL